MSGVDDPSVRSADSSLYQREPGREQAYNTKAGGGASGCLVFMSDDVRFS